MALPPPAADQTVRAAIYVRISKDDEGDLLGVGRQETDCRRLCEQKGWEVVELFVDDDISAWSGRPRPAWLAMLKAISAGEVNAVAVYNLDRLHRRPKDLETFFETCDGAGVRDLACVTGDFNIATSDGKYFARTLGNVAAHASDRASERIKRKLDDVAAEGRPHGGHRPFGYKVGGLALEEGEAALIREAAADVLKGAAVADIAREWNAAGATTPQSGGPWSVEVVRRLLARPRIAGLRVHRGEVVGPASWPAILDRATFEQLGAVLRTRGQQGRRGRPTMLGGLIRCGRCGQKMTHDLVNKHGGRSWRCHKRPGYANCGTVTCAAPPLEQLIIEAVMQRLDTPELARALAAENGSADKTAADELADAEARLDELTDMFSSGQIDRRALLRARASLERRQRAAQASLSRQRRATVLDAYAGRTGVLRESWDHLGLDKRRAILEAIVDHITIAPATRRGPFFDPERVDVTWKV
jgi:DNA invertase Pin-like site-specific DNA recombinase